MLAPLMPGRPRIWLGPTLRHGNTLQHIEPFSGGDKLISLLILTSYQNCKLNEQRTQDLANRIMLILSSRQSRFRKFATG
jgi:hypothetical protein